MIGSTHNHSTGSDGKLTPEDVIKKAISLGWDYIYFTDHYVAPPNTFTNNYYDDFFSEKYIDEIKRLKKEYKDKVEICFGVELGWFEGNIDWIKKELEKQDYDYVIGSVHEVYNNNKRIIIEPGREEWIKNLEEYGGIKKYIGLYYHQLKLLIKSNLFDSVGHLDYVKLYNENNEFFSDDEDWYKKEILEILDLIKKHKMALEINHSGIRKCKESFPSLWILKEANKRDIPITFGLDAHLQEHYDNNFIKELIGIAKKAGYDSVVRFKDRKMIEIKI